jgi:hypothetical protein
MRFLQRRALTVNAALTLQDSTEVHHGLQAIQANAAKKYLYPCELEIKRRNAGASGTCHAM